MIVQLTDAGAALLNANAGPIQLSVAKLGSASGYVPAGSDTNIHGAVVYTGVPSQFFVVNANIVKYSVYLDFDLGPLTFGELGLFTDTNVLFALAANDVLLNKIPISAGVTGNSMRLDVYLSMVGQNYEMWLDYPDTANPFQLAVLGSVDQLPPPKNAVPNAYIITGKGPGQSSFIAYTDRTGLWNFDAYAYANQATATVVGFDSQSVTIALADYLPGMNPQYPGEIIAEFSTGALFGICRYVSTRVIGATTVTFGFDNPLMATPIIGDKVNILARQALSTTIGNLPIATSTVLGAVIVGPTLTITADGLLDVAPTAFPVTSVNTMTGAVELTATDIPGFATVATTGNYNDLLNKPAAYILPIATALVLGGVKAPGNTHLTIAGDGTIDLGFNPVKTVNTVAPDANGNVAVVFNTIGLVAPAKIAAATDLNTMQTTGLFFVLDADSPSLLNGPGLASGRLGAIIEIEPFTTTATGGDVIQRWTEADAMYFRKFSKTGATWTPWVAVATSGSLPIATTTATGVVSVGTGLNVSIAGVLTSRIQTVNGKSDQNTVLVATDVGAIPIAQRGVAGGVATLDLTSATPAPATDPYTYGRLPFYQNTLGTLQDAGSWDAAANHVIQSHSTILTSDTNTALVINGQHKIDISYGGNGVAGLTVPDYQTVAAEGMMYVVSVAGTTPLDGVTSWAVGDIAVVLNGSWKKIPAGTLSVSSFNTRTGAVTLTTADITAASGATLANVAAAKYYDVPGGSAGPVTSSQVLLQHVSVRAITFPANFAGSQAYAAVPPTASTTLTVTVGVTVVGTITIAAGVHSATFASTGGTAVAMTANQVLMVTAPASADVTLASLSFTFLGLAT